METVRMAANPIDGICYSFYTPLDESSADEGGTWGGPMGSGMLMNADLEIRLNFTTQLIYSNMVWGGPINRENASDPNNGGIISKLELDEADWSPCTVTRSLRRLQVVDFSPVPLNIAEIVMAAKKHASQDGGKKVIQLDSVLMPFDESTWILLTIGCLLYGILLALHELVYRLTLPPVLFFTRSQPGSFRNSTSFRNNRSDTWPQSSQTGGGISNRMLQREAARVRAAEMRRFNDGSGLSSGYNLMPWYGEYRLTDQGIKYDNRECGKSSKAKSSIIFDIFSHCVDLIGSLLMKPLPDERIARGLQRLALTAWLLPSLILSLLYGGELICYLTNVSSGDLIKDWDELYTKMRRGEVYTSNFEHSWIRSEAASLFGADIAALINTEDTFEKCAMDVIRGVPPDPYKQWVWIDGAKEVEITLSKFHIRVPDDVYIMGEGQGLGSAFDGFTFNRRFRLKDKFNLWIRSYFELGLIYKWTLISDQEVATYYAQLLAASAEEGGHGAESQIPHDDQTEGDHHDGVVASLGLTDMASGVLCLNIFAIVSLVILLFELKLSCDVFSCNQL